VKIAVLRRYLAPLVTGWLLLAPGLARAAAPQETVAPTATSNVHALRQIRLVPTHLNTDRLVLADYQRALFRARQAVDIAARSPNTAGVEALQGALREYETALEFWELCIGNTNDWFCDEKLPVAAALMQRYPVPRNANLANVDRFAQPWIQTRVRATLREVVEYIPVSERGKVLKLLWESAQTATQQASRAIGE
jgi:hypothetical protein